MSQTRPSLDNYIDVAERIQHFKRVHPDGTLQTLGWEVTTIGDRAFVVYRAAAYRDPDDPRPGMGIAWEPFPGTTPYTKNSELMNAETAAWGRAIVACGFAANSTIASRQEVQARALEQDAQMHEAMDAAAEPHKDDARPVAPLIPRDRAGDILRRAVALNMATLDMDAPPGTAPEYHPTFKALLGIQGVAKIGQLNSDTAEAVEAWLMKEEMKEAPSA